MLLRDRTLPGLLAPLLVSISLMADRASAEQPAPQYLIFQIFIGTAEPASGVYHSGMSKPEIQAIARRIADTLRPERNIYKASNAPKHRNACRWFSLATR